MRLLFAFKVVGSRIFSVWCTFGDNTSVSRGDGAETSIPEVAVAHCHVAEGKDVHRAFLLLHIGASKRHRSARKEAE